MPSQENGVMDIGMWMSFMKYPMSPMTTKLTVTALQICKHSRKTFSETLLVQEVQQSEPEHEHSIVSSRQSKLFCTEDNFPTACRCACFVLQTPDLSNDIKYKQGQLAMVVFSF